MAAANLISLTTDFGLVDGFVGVLKGVILSINPQAQCVDITHEIPPQNIEQGAWVLSNSLAYFPPAAIHLCIVDPGVGSKRRALAIRVGETVLIGPDNGVLSPAVQMLEKVRGVEAQAFQLDKPRFCLPRVSTTFHGRDIFSPCAAHISRGVPLEEVGSPAGEWINLALPRPLRREDGALVGHVIHIDRYGNVVTDIDQQTIQSLSGRPLEVHIGGRSIPGLVSTYSDVEPGEFAALVGSPWKLEIARRNGNAAQALGLSIGDQVIVTPR